MWLSSDLDNVLLTLRFADMEMKLLLKKCKSTMEIKQPSVNKKQHAARDTKVYLTVGFSEDVAAVNRF